MHILYRAQGYDYLSTVGYAVSLDGVTIDHRPDFPIYRPSANFETNKTGTVNYQLMSAGGYGGCEDPRITLIDDRVYMVYVAFDGWSNLRLALTSIDAYDFLNQPNCFLVGNIIFYDSKKNILVGGIEKFTHIAL